MNKKLMGVLIPVLGGLAIVGSGFSAWYFGESTYDGTAAGTGTVTGVVDNGTLDVGGTEADPVGHFTVTLDQKQLVGTSGYGTSGITYEGNMTKTGTTEKYFGFVFDAGNKDVADLPYEAIKANVTLKNGEGNNVSSYISVKFVSINDTPATTGEGGNIGADGKLKLNNTEKSTVVLGLEWANNEENTRTMKPTTYLEYCQMLNALTGKTAGEAGSYTEMKNGVEEPLDTAKAGLSGDKSFTFSIDVTVTYESK